MALLIVKPSLYFLDEFTLVMIYNSFYMFCWGFLCHSWTILVYICFFSGIFVILLLLEPASKNELGNVFFTFILPECVTKYFCRLPIYFSYLFVCLLA